MLSDVLFFFILKSDRKMRDKNSVPSSRLQRESSADSPRIRNTLELDASIFFRRRSHKSSQPDGSEPVSPRFGATKVRPTNQCGDSNQRILEADLNSVTPSLSLGREYHPNVSDWNEKVQQEVRSGSGDHISRHVADPPRPPRAGYEWVWFPEGYWAERERVKSSLKDQKSRKWFRKSQERHVKPSPPFKGAMGTNTPADADVSGIKIDSNASHGRSKASQIAENNVRSLPTPGSKITRGLQYMSPTYPHFISPSRQPEGLYCKVKRGIEDKVVNRPQMVRANDPAIRTS